MIHIVLLFIIGMNVIKNVTSFDILNEIFASHEQMAVCRIGCMSKLIPLRQDSMCFRHSTCSSCWEFCQKFQLDKNEKTLFCDNLTSDVCDEGCKSACGSTSVEHKNNVGTTYEISTNFVGCTLFWKTSGISELIAINQLYGMDDQDTWFDLGQTTESFFTLLPRHADRATKLKLIVITEESGAVAETEISIGPERCISAFPKDFPLNDFPNFVGSMPSNPNQSAGNLKIATALLVVAFITLSTIVICIYARNKSNSLSSRSQNLEAQNELNNQIQGNGKQNFCIPSVNNLSIYV